MSITRILASLVGVLCAACYPVQEHPPGRAMKPNPQAPATVQSGPVKPQDPVKPLEPAAAGAAAPATPTEVSPATPKPAVQKTEAPAAAVSKAGSTQGQTYVTASKAPGRDGYVLSPYTGKLMLIRGIPSGTIVPDQTCPPGEAKFFRVP